MIEVRKYTKNNKKYWDDFIDSSKNSTFLFKRDYMDYHQDRFRDYSLIVVENNTLVATLPAHEVDTNTIASHLGLTYGGFILKKTETLENTLKIIHEVLFYLYSNGIEKIIFKSFHEFYNSIGSGEVNYALFIIKAKLVDRQISSVINLKEKLKFTRNRKSNVKKAKKLGILIKEVNDFDEYWNTILIPNLKNRFNAKPTHTIKEIEKLHAFFPNNIRQFNAYLENKLVAGATIYETPNVIRIQYNSANSEGKNTGASDLLYYQLIENYFKNKNFIDFGTSFDSKLLNSGLLNWKESFGARAYSIDTYEIKTKNYFLLESIYKAIKFNTA